MTSTTVTSLSVRLACVFPFGAEVSAIRPTATVIETIQPFYAGRVKMMGTTWRARCCQDVVLLSGETVQVVDRENLTLIVEPVR